MDKFFKFIRLLDAKLSRRVLVMAKLIESGAWERLDIKRLKGHENLFRCRIGKIRIIFQKVGPDQYVVIDADFRGDAYKKY